MMSPVRIAAIILVITTGLVVSYLITKNSASVSTPVDNGNKFTTDNSISSQLGKNPIEWTQKIASFIANSSSSALNYTSDITSGDESNATYSNSNPDSNDEAKGSSSANLTEFAAQSLFNHMRSLDQGNTNPFTNFDPNDAESQKLLADAMAGIQNQASLFQKNIEDKDLKILSDNSRNVKEQYLRTIKDVSQRRLGDPRYQRAAEEITQDAEQDCLSYKPDSVNLKLAGAYNEAAHDYLGTNVPSDWASLHKRMIAYFETGSSIYSALGNCSHDPIREYSAAQALPSFLESAAGVQNELNTKSKEIAL